MGTKHGQSYTAMAIPPFAVAIAATELKLGKDHCQVIICLDGHNNYIARNNLLFNF